MCCDTTDTLKSRIDLSKAEYAVFTPSSFKLFAVGTPMENSVKNKDEGGPNSMKGP